jgi:two-component system nitrate/nitrite response regulator NarL
MTEQIVRCVVADENRFYRAGLRQLMGHTGRATVVADCDDDVAVPVLAARTDAHVVLTGLPSLDRAAALAAELRSLSVVMIVDELRDDTVVAAVRAGVAGLIRRDISPGQLADVLHGVAGAAERARRDGEQLTSRELDVVRAVARGLSNRHVARSLGIAEQTVKNHLHHVMGKLGLSSRAELCCWEMERTTRPA